MGMAHLGGIQPDAVDPREMRQRLLERGKALFLAQMSQKAQDQA